MRVKDFLNRYKIDEMPELIKKLEYSKILQADVGIDKESNEQCFLLLEYSGFQMTIRFKIYKESDKDIIKSTFYED